MTDNTNNQKSNIPSLPKIIYSTHLILILAYSIYLIAQFNDIVSPSITFAMIVIYGFMAVWLLIISFILIVCKKHERAVCITRILVKLIIFLFPVFGLLSISKQKELNHKQILYFILYMGIICLLLVLYEVIGCCFFGKKYPEFLFEPNDLRQANTQVQNKRKQYNEMISKI